MRTKFTYFLTFVFALLVPLVFAQAQTMQISGTVTDEDGVPIPGVNITVQGGNTGTSSDFDGNYSIAVEQGGVLNFTSVGFQDYTVTVESDEVIDVALQSGTALDEVIVTAFGRKMTRNESTANVVSVGSEEITKSPFASAQEALQGKTPGLAVNSSSGVPGSAPEIRIRGMNSITASNSPLYVIDGVPVNSGSVGGSSDATSMDMLANLNPRDIEDISVLKDASAVAPYGAEGSNGVILITTKSGERGKPRYNLSYNLRMENPARRGLQMMNAEERYDVWHRAAWNAFLGDPADYDPNDSGISDQIDDFYMNSLEIDDIAHWQEIGSPDINWYNEVRNKNAITNELNFSVSQGDDQSSLYASVGYTHSEGAVVNSDFERISGNIKYNRKLRENISLDISANVSNAKQDGILEEAAFFSNPNLAKYFIPSWTDPRNPDGSLNIDDFSDYSGGLFNVLYTQENDYIRNSSTRALQNTAVTWDILDNLTFTTRLGLDYTSRSYNHFQNREHGDGEDSNGSKTETIRRLFHYTTQNTLDYSFDLGDKNHFRATAVQEYSRYEDHDLNGYGENMPEGMTELGETASNWEAESFFSDRMSMRYVGLLNYDFDKRYLVNASYSYQGDSRFSEHWGNFYSLGLGWNIQNESFMENADFVDELRLKLGYGRTGNAGIDRNAYQELYGFNTYRNNPNVQVVGYGSNITWEKSDRMDISADFAFFSNRLTGSVGYYINETKDMLFRVPLPFSEQFMDDDETRGNAERSSVLRNGGTMENHGVEFQVNGDIIRTPDWNWNVGFNIATVKNKIKSMPEASETFTNTWANAEGHQVYEWYMRDWAGVDPDNGDALWYVNKDESDETTNEASQAERRFQGKNRLPRYTGGVSTRLDFKNFFLEGQLYFAGGNKIWEDWSQYVQSTGTNVLGFNVTKAAYEGAWREPGDTDATYPRFDISNGNVDDANGVQSTRFLRDGDYIRLRDIAIGYTFDKNVLGNSFLDAVTLSIRGTNLWTWVKDSNLEYDPEVRVDGFTNLTAPPVKSVSFNVNINF